MKRLICSFIGILALLLAGCSAPVWEDTSGAHSSLSSASSPADNHTAAATGKTSPSSSPATDLGGSDIVPSSAPLPQQTTSSVERSGSSSPSTNTPKPSRPATTSSATSSATSLRPAPTRPSRSTTTTTRKATVTGGAEFSSFAGEVLRLVNVEREKAGLPPLSTDAPLTAAAEVRAREIVSLFDHTRPDGSSCFTVLDGYAYRAAGENIAYGQSSPEQVMNSWMNSPGHRANILSASFNRMGIGVYQAGRTIYWTQLFVQA